jgi:hypothetical protein
MLLKIVHFQFLCVHWSVSQSQNHHSKTTRKQNSTDTTHSTVVSPTWRWWIRPRINSGNMSKNFTSSEIYEGTVNESHCLRTLRVTRNAAVKRTDDFGPGHGLHKCYTQGPSLERVHRWSNHGRWNGLKKITNQRYSSKPWPMNLIHHNTTVILLEKTIAMTNFESQRQGLHAARAISKKTQLDSGVQREKISSSWDRYKSRDGREARARTN